VVLVFILNEKDTTGIRVKFFVTKVDGKLLVRDIDFDAFNLITELF
jgi:hypothetical protein